MVPAAVKSRQPKQKQARWCLLLLPCVEPRQGAYFPLFDADSTALHDLLLLCMHSSAGFACMHTSAGLACTVQLTLPWQCGPRMSGAG